MHLFLDLYSLRLKLYSFLRVLHLQPPFQALEPVLGFDLLQWEL